MTFHTPIDNTDHIIAKIYIHIHVQNYTHAHRSCTRFNSPRFRPNASPLRARVRLFLLAGGRFQLGTTVVLAAVWVSPHFGGRGYLDTSVGVDAPTLAPLSVAGHVALEHKREKMMREGRGNGGCWGLNEALRRVRGGGATPKQPSCLIWPSTSH